MFTGIVEELGRLQAIEALPTGARLRISCSKVLEDVHLGDSIAVDGVCLTVTAFSQGEFSADAMAETLRKTTLAKKRPGDLLHLERAMGANGRFGGHFVLGHVDDTGRILSLQEEGFATRMRIGASPTILDGIVEKASVAIDGVSLTVMDFDRESFTVGLIPHTKEHTHFSRARPGDFVNLETDILGKYARKSPVSTGLTTEDLLRAGF